MRVIYAVFRFVKGVVITALVLVSIPVLLVALPVGLAALMTYLHYADRAKERRELERWKARQEPVRVTEPEPSPKPIRVPRGVPMAERKLYRWHRRDLLWGGDDFWRTFEDGPWKWDAAARFAGKGLNCGHYFAFTPDGAANEAGFYGLDTHASDLLCINASLESVLDLTYPENVRDVLRASLRDADDLSYVSRMLLLSLVATSEKGGDTVTDAVGYWAREHGYEGVLFFSARSIDAFQTSRGFNLRDRIDAGRDSGWGFDFIEETMDEMSRDDSLLNLVVFSGASLLRSISQYESPSLGSQTSRFHSSDPGDLDRLFTYGDSYQEERRRFTYLAPRIVLNN